MTILSPNNFMMMMMSTMMIMMGMMLSGVVASPSHMCIMVIIMSIMMSSMIQMTFPSSIMAFIIFLSISGGIMILFMYFTSLSPKIKMSTKKLMILSIMPTMMVISWISNKKINQFMQMKMIKPINSDISSQIFMKSSMSVTMMTIIFLILVLLSMIKICSKSTSPMRRKK